MGEEELETAQVWTDSLKHFTVNGLVIGTGSGIKRICFFSFLTLEKYSMFAGWKKIESGGELITQEREERISKWYLST